MAGDLPVTVKNEALQDALQRLMLGLPASGDMSPAMRDMARVLKTGALLRFRAAKGPDGNDWKKSRRAETEGGGPTLSQSGRLRRSITTQFDRKSATVGTNAVYAAIHQFGGIIRAKAGPFLAIPVTDLARESKNGPTSMPGLRVWQTLEGQYVLGDEKGTVHFLLRRQVTMPARPFFGASEGDQTELKRVVQLHLQNLWKR